MIKYPCKNCIVEPICTQQCPKFSAIVNHLVKLAEQAQEKYSEGNRGLNYDPITNTQMILSDMARFNIRTKGDVDFAHLVHTFNKIHAQVCRIDSNNNRKVFGNGKR